MDAAGIDLQVLSCTSPGPQAFEAAAAELERAVTTWGVKGAMSHGHTRGGVLEDMRYRVIFARAQALGVPTDLQPAHPHPEVVNAYGTGYEELARAAWGVAVESRLRIATAREVRLNRDAAIHMSGSRPSQELIAGAWATT